MIEIVPGGMTKDPEPPCTCFCTFVRCRLEWGYMEGYADGVTTAIAENPDLEG